MAQVESANSSEAQASIKNEFANLESQSQDGNQGESKDQLDSSEDHSNDCDTKDTKNQSYDCNNDHDTSNNDTDDSTKTNLIVNYLPQQMTDEEFEGLFKKFGAMKSCKIVRNKGSGYSYGFGFVDFETHEQALQAIDELNGHELETKKIKVAFARPAGQDIKQANLYIKNVPNDWSQDEVRKVFEPYGNIIQVRVLGNNRGVAFVLYDLRKQAEDALDALNGKTLDGCEVPLEIKFAADKKTEKGSGSGSGSRSNNNNNTPTNGGGSGRRERGRRGGRNRDRNGNRQRSFFDRQNNNGNSTNSSSNNNNNNNNYNDRSNSRGRNQYNPVPYGGGAQYQDNLNNNPNGVGPVRQTNNRQNRYAPFVPIQQPTMASIAPTQQMIPQMTPNPAYGFAAQQQMIPYSMVPTQQMASMQPISQMGQLAHNQMAAMYGAVQMPMGYAPMAQSTMDSIYSVASNNMNNAANMQPQIGQPMTMRNNTNSNTTTNNNSGSGGFDDGVTLFVYNIGPDTDENEMRTMFSPYGLVVKCNVVRKTPGGETKGFGFVTLKDRNQANAAIAGMNGSMRNGRTLQVSLKK